MGPLLYGHRLACLIVRLLETIIRSQYTNYKSFSNLALYFANLYEFHCNNPADFGINHKRRLVRFLPRPHLAAAFLLRVFITEGILQLSNKRFAKLYCFFTGDKV